jgi:hypothetical protein
VHDLVLEENALFDWGGGIQIEGDAAQVTDVEFNGNDVQDVTLPLALLEQLDSRSTATIHSSWNRFYCVPARGGPDWTEVDSVPRPLDYWFSLVGDGTSVAEQVTYVDPHRSVASYIGQFSGIASLDEFLGEARLQSSARWHPVLLAVSVARYIRAGF